MNPFLVIGVFTVILAVVVYWLQGRQGKADDEEIKRATQKKEIKVVKKADWIADEEPEPEPTPEPEAVSMPDPEPAPDPTPETEPRYSHPIQA